MTTSLTEVTSALDIPDEPDRGRMYRESGTRLRSAMSDHGVDALILLGNGKVPRCRQPDGSGQRCCLARGDASRTIGHGQRRDVESSDWRNKVGIVGMPVDHADLLFQRHLRE